MKAGVTKYEAPTKNRFERTAAIVTADGSTRRLSQPAPIFALPILAYALTWVRMSLSVALVSGMGATPSKKFAAAVLPPRCSSYDAATPNSGASYFNITDHSRHSVACPATEPLQVPWPGELPVPAASRPNE